MCVCGCVGVYVNVRTCVTKGLVEPLCPTEEREKESVGETGAIVPLDGPSVSTALPTPVSKDPVEGVLDLDSSDLFPFTFRHLCESSGDGLG